MNSSKVRKRKKRVLKIDPEEQALFDELCETLKKLGVEIRIEPGHFNGGYCVVGDQQFFFLNKNHLLEQNIDLLTMKLKRMDLKNIYLAPRIRDLLEENEFITGKE